MSIAVAALGGNKGSGSSAISASFGPAVGDMILAFTAMNGNTSTRGSFSDNAGDGGGWGELAELSNANGRITAWVRSKGPPNQTIAFTFTPDAAANDAAFYVTNWSGASLVGSDGVRQSATGSGSSSAPATTFGVAARTQDAILVAEVDFGNNASALTAPTSYASALAATQNGIRLSVSSRNTGETGTTITWGATSGSSAWLAIAIELIPGNEGTTVNSNPSSMAQGVVHGMWAYDMIAGYPRQWSKPMVIVPWKLSTAIDLRVRMLSKISSRPMTGLSGFTWTVQGKKTGGSLATITPSSIVEDGDGWYTVSLPSSAENTLGFVTMYIDVAAQVGTEGAFCPSDIVLDVVAYDQQDGVRLGLTALPNAAAGANGGLPLVGSQIPNANVGAANGLLTQGSGTAQIDTDGDGNVPVNGGTVTVSGTVVVGSYDTGQEPGGQIKPNSLVDNNVYGISGGSNGKVVSWRLRVFETKADRIAATPGAPNNTDGEIERYLGSATYNSDGTLATYANDKDL